MTFWQRRRISRVVAAFLTFGCGYAWATAALVQSAPDLVGLPWVQITVGAAISSWGGAAATLGRYLDAVTTDRPFRWRAEVARDLVVSVTVGAASYMGSAWYGLGPLPLGLLLLLGGYLGARVLSVAADRLLSMISTRPI